MHMRKKIRVMIVDDSVFFRGFLARALEQNPRIEIVGVAGSAMEAISMIAVAKPDVITLDMVMPKMRGDAFLQKIKPLYPKIQVIVISSVSSNVFDALRAGAMDFVSKPNPQAGVDNNAFISEITSKIYVAGTAAMVASPSPTTPRPVKTEFSPKAISALSSLKLPLPLPLRFPTPRSVVAIGASTGGTEAILAVVKALPENTPGVVIVQHMPPVFTQMYAERLDKMCSMTVREARSGDRVVAGTVLLAAGDKHMRMRSDAQGYYVSCEAGEKVSGHCPSVDTLFDSVADTAGANAVGVLLTGMGADGAKGLLKMRGTGAHTIGQDQATSAVYGMPMAAFNMGAVAEQLPLPQIADAVLRALCTPTGTI